MISNLMRKVNRCSIQNTLTQHKQEVKHQSNRSVFIMVVQDEIVIIKAQLKLSKRGIFQGQLIMTKGQVLLLLTSISGLIVTILQYIPDLLRYFW